MRKNKIREIWKAGKNPTVAWMNTPDTYVAQIMAQVGYDALLLDTQHGMAIGPDRAALWIQAVATTDTVPFVRVPWNEPFLIQYMLDAGAGGIVVPLVNNYEEAAKAGGAWVLNGSKTFTTHGRVGDVFVAMAVTDRAAGAKGISAFIIEKGTPGMTPGRKEDKIGMRASDTSEVLFENCAVPDEQLLGEENRGFVDTMQVLDASMGGFRVRGADVAVDELIELELTDLKQRYIFPCRVVWAAMRRHACSTRSKPCGSCSATALAP